MSKFFQQAAKAAKSAGQKGGPSPPGSGSGGAAAVGFLLGLGALGYGGYNSIYTVEGGHRAVMFNRVTGVSDKVMKEGTHIMIPWFDMPIIYDVRTRPRNIQSLTGSKDLQMVNITLRVLSKPDPRKLPTIFKRLGQDYDERVLPSIVNETLKQVVAQYNAAQLLTQRDTVSRQIRDHLVARARDFNIMLDDVSITHLTFSKEYTAAIEAKQVAQQDAERARFLVERALQDKKSTVIRAEGEAQAAEMVGKAVAQNPGFINLRRLDVAREISSTVARSQNKIFLNSESLLLNLLDDSKKSSLTSSPSK